MVREMQESGILKILKKMFLETFLPNVYFSYTVLFHRKKQRQSKKYQKSKQNMSLKTCFCYLKLYHVNT